MRTALLVLAVACQRSSDAPPAPSPPPPPPASTATPPSTAPGRPVPALPVPLPGKRRDITALVGTAQRIAIGEVGGAPALVVADAEHLRVLAPDGKELARAPVPGGIQTLSIARGEILAGWGLSREHRDAKARVTIERLAKGTLAEELVLAPTTERQDVQAVQALGDGELSIAYFDTKYTVAHVIAKRAGSAWTAGPATSIRMATSWVHAELGDVVGRLYGDAKGVDGDAFVLAADGKRTPLPTTRGVQGLAVLDGAIYVGDGWHQNYGQLARGLLTEITHDASGYHASLIEDTAGQFTIWEILVADVDGDGQPDLVTRGSHYVRVYHRANGGWRGLTIAGAARDIAVGHLEGTGDQIAIVGDASAIVDLHGVSW